MYEDTRVHAHRDMQTHTRMWWLNPGREVGGRTSVFRTESTLHQSTEGPLE